MSSPSLSLFISALFFALAVLFTFVVTKRAKTKSRSMTLFGPGRRFASGIEDYHNNLLSDGDTGYVEDVLFDTSVESGFLVIVDSPHVATHADALLYDLPGHVEVADFTGKVKLPQDHDLIQRMRFLPVQGYLKTTGLYPHIMKGGLPDRVEYDRAVAIALYASSLKNATVVRGDTMLTGEPLDASVWPDVDGSPDLCLFNVRRPRYRGLILIAMHQAIHGYPVSLDFVAQRPADGMFPSFIELPTGYLLPSRVYPTHITRLASAERELWPHLRHVLVASDIVSGPLGPERIGESKQLRPMDNGVRQMLHRHLKAVQRDRR